MVSGDPLLVLSMASLPMLLNATFVTESGDPLTTMALAAMSCIAPPAKCRAPPVIVNPSSNPIDVFVSVDAAVALMPAQSPLAAAGHEPDTLWRNTES